jgi:hypothetical protein
MQALYCLLDTAKLPAWMPVSICLSESFANKKAEVACIRATRVVISSHREAEPLCTQTYCKRTGLTYNRTDVFYHTGLVSPH